MKYFLVLLFFIFNTAIADIIEVPNYTIVKDVEVVYSNTDYDSSDILKKAEFLAIQDLKNKFSKNDLTISPTRFLKKRSEDIDGVKRITFDVYFDSSSIKNALLKKNNNIYKTFVKIDISNIKKLNDFFEKVKKIDSFHIKEVSESFILAMFSVDADYLYDFLEEDFDVSVKDGILNVDL